MSKTREQLARQWAERIMSTTLERIDPVQRAAAEFILANTKPETMADVEWDDEKHHLAGAECVCDGVELTVAMVGETRDGEIYAIDLDENHGFWPMPANLTPNGKYYKLVEVTEPAHPAVLSTLKDYETAPEGTIISRPGGLPWVKEDGLWCSPVFRESSEFLALGWNQPFTVLRWGDEA